MFYALDKNTYHGAADRGKPPLQTVVVCADREQAKEFAAKQKKRFLARVFERALKANGIEVVVFVVVLRVKE